jgi:hypothetical protein
MLRNGIEPSIQFNEPMMRTILSIVRTVLCCFLLATATNLSAQSGGANTNRSEIQESKTIPVTWETFVKAETHRTFSNYVQLGAFGQFSHVRALTPIDKQDVVRLNRDTRYSMGVFDLTTPLTVTLPDAGNRYIAMQVINEEEYTKAVLYSPGPHVFTQEKVGSRYVCLIVRILINSEDVKDDLIVTQLQDKILVSQAAMGKFEIPNWDKASLDRIRDALRVVASTLTDTRLCFGDVNEVNPIAHLLGAAAGWGGNPPNAALYLNIVPEMNDGKTPYTLTLKEVPVDGFWSISVYNKNGYFEVNPYNAYSKNSFSAKKEKDGSVVIHFGGDPKQPNYLPISNGWNYLVRLYRAKSEILDGTWKFPKPVQVK